MAELTYSYRPHALAPERHYRLEAEALAWTSGGREDRVAYRDVERAHIFKNRFIGSSTTYWNCVLFTRSGGKIKLGAGHRTGLRKVEDQSATYIPFIKELEARLAAANPKLQVVAHRGLLTRVEDFGGVLVVWLLRRLRRFDADRIANFAGPAMRRVGPWLRGHSRAREQVAIAFPEKSAAEIEQILSGMWDNLGRLSAEYVHLDHIWDFDLDNPGGGRIIADAATVSICRRLKAQRGPALMFGAHLSNWEVSGLAGHILTPHIAMIYKAPRIAAIAGELQELRRTSGAELLAADARAPIRIAQALKRGDAVAMLVDEHYSEGVDVTMFNRPIKVNPLFARYVRMFDCPFHGFRTVRLPGGRFRLDITEAIAAPRDADGKVDVAGTMQAVASTIQGWVREHPEQFLWLHRRWR